MRGIVYSETVVHMAPERYLADAPYQIAIIETGDSKTTARIAGDRVRIGDSVEFIESRDGVQYFRLVSRNGV